MRDPWVRRDVGKQPKLSALCEHLGVPFEPSKLHDATYDTRALAMCMQEARTRGLEWIAKQAPPPGKSYRFRWHGMEHGKGYLEAWPHLPRLLAEALVTPETEEERLATCMSTPLG